MSKINKFNKNLILSTLFLVISVLLNTLMSRLIEQYFPDRPILDDLLFRITSYYPFMQYYSDIALISASIILIFYIFPRRVKDLPYFLASYGLVELFRSLLVLLTPMGRPTGNGEGYGLFPFIIQTGMFPSGHTAVNAMIWLVIEQKKSPLLKCLAFVMLILQMTSLILSRGHYSIDIVGGLLIAYIAYLQKERLKNMLYTDVDIAK